MIKNTIYFITLLVALFSCNNSVDIEVSSEDKSKSGGELVIPIVSYFKIEKPVSVIKIQTAQIAGQVFEGLLKYNCKTLEIEPALAEKWSISDDGLTYTFTLRDSVKFHDNSCFPGGKGRLLNTKDVVEMFYRIYTNDIQNVAYAMFQNTIVGGDDFFNGDSTTISGLKYDDKTITVTLEELSKTFLSKLVTIFTSIVPKEAFSQKGFTMVGTGPFIFDANTSGSELVVLNKNESYWKSDTNGVQLPYLDKLSFKYYENDDERMDDFWDNKIAIVKNLPITKVSEVLEERIADFKGKKAKYILKSIPQMSTTYLEFNMNSKIFKDERVRKAISLAIDKTKLVEKTLKNQAYQIGKFGITPPLPKVYKGYDFKGIEKVGYSRNSVKAKQLLSDAGYPNGKGFPSLTCEFKKDNSRYLVMSEIQRQLKSVLNINMAIEQVEFNQLIENNANGTADIFHQVWIGDFASPESFLINFYGKLVPKDKSEPSLVNGGRYVNKEFDEFYEKALSSHSLAESYEMFAAAEKVLLKNPPLVVLYYGENLWLKQANLKGFYTNGMNYLDFTEVYNEEVFIELEK